MSAESAEIEDPNDPVVLLRDLPEQERAEFLRQFLGNLVRKPLKLFSDTVVLKRGSQDQLLSLGEGFQSFVNKHSLW